MRIVNVPAYIGKDVSLSEKRLEIRLQPKIHRCSQRGVTEESTCSQNPSPENSVPTIVAPPVLHRIAEVRLAQHLSLACLARRLGKEVAEIRELERSTTDMALSELYRISAALDVPVSELLVESTEAPSDPVRNRGRLLRIMKTARTIFERTQESRTGLLAQTLIDQLVDLMPELEDISSWPDIGQSREFKDYGVAVIRRFDAGVVSELEKND